MEKKPKDVVLRKSAQQDGAHIFVNSVFSKAYDNTAMDFYKESPEVFGMLFSDQNIRGAEECTCGDHVQRISVRSINGKPRGMYHIHKDRVINSFSDFLIHTVDKLTGCYNE